MKSVRVRAVELLEVLKTNRTQHMTEYQSAMEVYKKEVVAKLKHLLADARKEAEKDVPSFDLSVGLAEPRSYAESYDTAIKMLEMSTDEIIELSQTEFSQYVEDNWSWQSVFKSVTGAYNSSK